MPEKPLVIDSYWWKYATSEDWVLKDINLEISEGEFLLITGPTGAGKTTLCLSMAGLIPHHYNGYIKGSVYIFGRKTSEIPSHEIAKMVGIVFQDPESQFLTMSVEDEIAFSLENLALSREEIRERIYEAAGLVKVEDLLERAPYELSGGQKQRVAIAAALAMKPKILIMDEPTGQLDPIGKEEVVSVLERLKKEGITVVLVEHIIEEVASFVDRFVLMKDGMIVYNGGLREFLKDEKAARSAGVPIPQVTEFWYKLKEKIRGFDTPPITLNECEQILKQVLQVKKIE